MYLLYDLLLLFAIPLLAPYALLKGLRYDNLLRGLGERFALYRPGRLVPLRNRKVIWVHAVSVGETRASIPLLKELRASFPDAAIVLSSLTYTGRSTAEEIDVADLRVFLPYDLPWIVARALRQTRPDLILLVETEIWPNFIRKSAAQGVPVVMVNGRISDRSFPRYWLARPLLSPILGAFRLFCMQSRLDQLRIIRLGADSDRTTVTGNLKFDLPAPDFSEADIALFRKELRLPDKVPVWVAGSTREGEEEIILEAFRALLERGLKLVLILVPRYPDRARAVCDLVARTDLACRLRSELGKQQAQLSSGDIVVGDTLGEMLKFYACADVVFVGGSLVPIGGHNILEASLLSKPVLFGPHMQNFKSISQLLLEAEGGLQVDEDEIAEKVAMLLDSPPLRRKMGEKGQSLFAEHSGATRRTVDSLQRFMER